jgi:lysophospholipase L1-like esterase
MSSPRETACRAGLLAVAAGAWACGAAQSGAQVPSQRVGVEVQPTSAQVQVLGQVPFQAAVTGTIDTSVRWSVVEAGGGTVDATGRYQAGSSTGSFHVRATSVADPGASGAATVTVIPATSGGPAPLPLLARAPGYNGASSGGGAAIDLGAARQQLLLAWQIDGDSYDASIRGGFPGSVPAVYTVETSAAPGGPWTVRVTCNSTPRTATSRNALSSRQHAFSAQGDRYLRLRITGGATVLTRLDVLDASGGTDDDFILFGDSITQFAGEVGLATSISDRIATLTGNVHRPFVQKAGITYDKYDGTPPSSFDTDSRQRLGDYLPLFPGKYVGLAYGTNDTVNNQQEIDGFKAAIRACLDLVLAAGKVPVVATVPWNATQTPSSIQARNGHLAAVLAEPAYVGRWEAGPDLYAFFSQPANQHFITDNDGLHPSVAGNDEWRRLWAEAIVASVYGP